MSIITNPEAITTITRISPKGVTPADYRVVLAGRGVGVVSDEAGAVPSRGSFMAWSVRFGPKGFQATMEEAAARVVAAWLNVGTGPTRLMTANGTVHASRLSDVEGSAGRAPACMSDRVTAGLRVLLRSGLDVTCKRCPKH